MALAGTAAAKARGAAADDRAAAGGAAAGEGAAVAGAPRDTAAGLQREYCSYFEGITPERRIEICVRIEILIH